MGQQRDGLLTRRAPDASPKSRSLHMWSEIMCESEVTKSPQGTDDTFPAAHVSVVIFVRESEVIYYLMKLYPQLPYNSLKLSAAVLSFSIKGSKLLAMSCTK